jgi:hypothetical protein
MIRNILRYILCIPVLPAMYLIMIPLLICLTKDPIEEIFKEVHSVVVSIACGNI